jgi:hypothetical protein
LVLHFGCRMSNEESNQQQQEEDFDSRLKTKEERRWIGVSLSPARAFLVCVLLVGSLRQHEHFLDKRQQGYISNAMWSTSQSRGPFLGTRLAASIFGIARKWRWYNQQQQVRQKKC